MRKLRLNQLSASTPYGTKLRDDVIEKLRHARNGGSAGVDRMTFDQITAYGRERWLEELRQELRAGEYRPQPLLRVWIPKSNGGQRPLGVPCIRDRVVEMAALLVLGPIFEADLLRNQYGFRPEMDAKMAFRQASARQGSWASEWWMLPRDTSLRTHAPYALREPRVAYGTLLSVSELACGPGHRA